MAAGGKTVLVVDDEADVLAYVQAVLEDNGYTFLTARDGDTALALAKSKKPDLILLDVQMPKKNGFEVFGALRAAASTASIPVIMLTGISERTGIRFDGKTMAEYYGSEPERYIEKPIEATILQDAVSELLD